MPVASEIDPILNDSFMGVHSTPLNLKYKQWANFSTAAMKIAASPPNNRNDRNTTESEKLRTNFERGNVRLIRGAIATVYAKSKANFHVRTSALR